MLNRSDEKEIIDLGPQYYSAKEYSDFLKKLFKVNQWFGFFTDTARVLKKFPKASTLLDIGCGGGLFLLHLNKHFPHIKMTGTDISAQAIEECNISLWAWQKKHPQVNVHFELQRERQLHFTGNTFDLILVTLVCHHLQDEDLITFLQQIYAIAKNAVIINDLQRHRLAGWLYRFISPVLFRNRLITHDGLISIRRGFIYTELKSLLQKSGIANFKIKWRFPFRWQIILQKN